MNYEVISIETARIMAEIEKENKELQDRIDKALEYIKINEFYLDYKTGACIKGVMPLLNILQGENNE